jgi:Ni,Fe-hydrogenase I cytochrome b subunit
MGTIIIFGYYLSMLFELGSSTNCAISYDSEKVLIVMAVAAFLLLVCLITWIFLIVIAKRFPEEPMIENKNKYIEMMNNTNQTEIN